MKNNLFNKTLICTLTLSMVFVSFAQNSAPAADTDYIEEEKNTSYSTEEADQYVDVKNANKKNSKEIHNPFEGFFSTKQSNYIFYDEMNLSTGTIGASIKPKVANVFVNPKTQTPGIQVYYQSAWYNFMFDQKAYSIIAEGLDKYIEDFEAHRLIKNKYMKTRRMYSEKGKCRVEWGSVKIMQNYWGDAYFHVGYEFKNNSPYFCIIVKDCKNLAQDQGQFAQEKSIEVQLYFTKAQAKDLLSKISKSAYSDALFDADDEIKVQSDEY